MKKIFMKVIVILFYLFFLLYVTGFEWRKIIDIKSICSVAIGMCLLSLPGKQYLSGFAWNALFASYIAAAVFLLSRFGAGMAAENITEEIALGCRPILYGLLFYVIFQKEEKEEDQETKKQEMKGACPYTAEQISHFFQAKGLTAREAEVAKLLYQGYTNRAIAEELYISEATVKKHVTHILNKLNIQSRMEMKEIVEKES